MNEPMTAPVPRSKPSRKVAVFASLWVVAGSMGVTTNGTLLLNTVFASLTVVAIGRMMVKETMAAGRMRFGSALHLVAWFVWLLLFALAPLWLNLSAVNFAYSR